MQEKLDVPRMLDVMELCKGDAIEHGRNQDVGMDVE